MTLLRIRVNVENVQRTKNGVRPRFKHWRSDRCIKGGFGFGIKGQAEGQFLD